MDKKTIGGACFDCKNSTNARNNGCGWSYDCKHGIDNRKMNGGIQQVLSCPKGEPRIGFQVGGYYTHMWFEQEDNRLAAKPGQCLRWVVMSDGEFPIQDDDDGTHLEFHICRFEQIEYFVEFWRGELERKGLLEPKDRVDVH